MITLAKPIRQTKLQHQVAFCKVLEGSLETFLNTEQYPCRCPPCHNCMFDYVAPVDCAYGKMIQTKRKQKVEIVRK
jgi:hypothetical protein